MIPEPVGVDSENLGVGIGIIYNDSYQAGVRIGIDSESIGVDSGVG